MNTDQHTAGYRIDKIYVAEQAYKIVEKAGLTVGPEPADRPVNFGWDWRPVSSRKFEVIIDLSVDPVVSAAEKLSVRLIGLFSAEEGDISIGLPDFLRYNAPAILFPFAREVISAMSGRGLYGALHIKPINIVTLFSEFSYPQSTGFVFLEANPDFAKDFQLEYRTTPQPSRVADQTAGLANTTGGE
jgi:preprotein translocase subunit SecB